MPQNCPILAADPANIEHCAQLLRSGEVVAVPTETVYGLAGNALDEASVGKIFAVKGRPLIDPLIVHFPSIEAVSSQVVLNDAAHQLATHFWPGALTMVLPKQASIPDLVTAGLSSVAVRVPKHPVFHKLLTQIDFPLAAPSANPFGYVSPTLAGHVASTLGTRIPAVLDGGPCNHGLESTIIDLRQPEAPRILRPGPISKEAIEAVLKLPIGSGHTPSSDAQAQAAPGMLTQHYSPNTPIQLFEAGRRPEAQAGQAVVYTTKPESIDAQTFWLSEHGDLPEIAHNLFKLIQRLDTQNYKCLLVERAEQAGIGIAINDRLSRAAAKR